MYLDDAELDAILARRHRPVVAAQDVERLVHVIRAVETPALFVPEHSLERVDIPAAPGAVIGDFGEVDPGPDPITLDDAAAEAIARVCHEANRAYCLTIGDDSQPSWDDAPDWRRDSSINGVRFHAANPSAGPEASHENWLREKEADGWKYGEVKDPEKKEHPCYLPFNELPIKQQRKDSLFRSVVHALLGWS